MQINLRNHGHKFKLNCIWFSFFDDSTSILAIRNMNKDPLRAVYNYFLGVCHIKYDISEKLNQEIRNFKTIKIWAQIVPNFMTEHFGSSLWPPFQFLLCKARSVMLNHSYNWVLFREFWPRGFSTISWVAQLELDSWFYRYNSKLSPQ